MTLNKFQKIKIKKDAKYWIHYRILPTNTEAFIYKDGNRLKKDGKYLIHYLILKANIDHFIYEFGKDIIKTDKYIIGKKWIYNKIHYRLIKKIEEVRNPIENM